MSSAKKSAKTTTKSRNLEESRKAILQVAFLEIYTKGFQGVSVDDLVKKTPYTKGAFYHQFPTKLELGYALVDEVIAPMIIDRWIAPLENFENPVEGILKQMRIHFGDANGLFVKYGCPLNNLVQEMAPVDREFKKRLQNALNLWISETDKYIRLAQGRGLIKKNIESRSVAEFIVMSHEGFFGLIKGLETQKVFKSLMVSLEIYLRAISA